MDYRSTRIPRWSCRQTPIGSQSNRRKELDITQMGYRSVKELAIYIPPKTSFDKLLEDMLLEKFFWDITIHIEEEIFECNVLAMRCYSNYFIELENDIRLMNLFPENVTADSLEIVCDWILYPDIDINRRYIVEVFNTSTYLDIEELVEACWLFLSSDEISEEIAFEIYVEARARKCYTIMDIMLSRISKFFLVIVSCKQFVELSLFEVLPLLQSSMIAVNSEMEVFLAGVRWLAYDWRHRKRYVVDIMRSMRFSLMPAIELLELNRKYDVNCFDLGIIVNILENPQVIELINDAVEHVAVGFWKKSKYCLQPCPILEQYIRDKAVPSRICITDPLKLDFRASSIYEAFTQFRLYLNALRAQPRDYYKTLEKAMSNCNLTYLVTMGEDSEKEFMSKSETSSSCFSQTTISCTVKENFEIKRCRMNSDVSEISTTTASVSFVIICGMNTASDLSG